MQYLSVMKFQLYFDHHGSNVLAWLLGSAKLMHAEVFKLMTYMSFKAGFTFIFISSLRKAGQ